MGQAYGDISSVCNAAGRIRAEYAYDAYGNCAIWQDSTGGFAEENPFRYRGYFYDTETGFYYCQTRYYNPAWGRFISMDDVDYVDPQAVSGLNLYAYCNGDPINFSDETGHFSLPNWAKWLIGGAAFAGAVALTIASGGTLAPVFAGMATSIISGGIIGGITSAVHGNNFGKGFADGAADGALWGGIASLFSASIGMAKYAMKGGQGAVQGTKRMITIKRGQVFDRYGSTYGRFITDFGTPIEQLALPPGNSGIKTTLQATKNFRVYTGTVAAAYGKPGGGTQYVLRYSLKTLIEKGWLSVV